MLKASFLQLVIPVTSPLFTDYGTSVLQAVVQRSVVRTDSDTSLVDTFDGPALCNSFLNGSDEGGQSGR